MRTSHPCQPEQEEEKKHENRKEKKKKNERKKEKSLFVSYGNTQGQTQALINYTLHLHIPGIRHYANSSPFA